MICLSWAWIEFSADDDAETDDLSQLKQANPSYPKRTPLRAIRKLRRRFVSCVDCSWRTVSDVRL